MRFRQGPDSSPHHQFAWSGLVLLTAFSFTWPTRAAAQLVVCGEDGGAVRGALTRLRHSVDPCGQAGEIAAVLDKVERCAARLYNVCTDTTAARNVFDRPASHLGKAAPRAITWNPALRTEVEFQCGASAHPLLRDPTASLLHELVHAAQDCDGLNPGEHELEAVRIENIYRRAVGLCQRAGYGEERLPASMVVECPMRRCSCSTPAPPEIAPADTAPETAIALTQESDSAGTAEVLTETSGDRPSSH